MAAQLSSKGIPHYDPLLYFPSGLLTTVNSSLCPGIGFQSIRPSSPLPCVPGELGPCPGNLVLQQGLSVWFSLHSDCHKSAAALSNSLKCFPDLKLLQFPHPPSAGPAHSPSLFPSLLSSYRVLPGSIYSFPVVRDSCPISAVVLQCLLHLKMYS